MQHVFALQGRGILAPNLAGDLLHFRLNLRVDFLELIIQLSELGIRRAELGAEIRSLNLDFSLLGAQGFEES